ncbi:MAG: PIN domain-containing protein [Candidatus Anstonellaceae archaeon]
MESKRHKLNNYKFVLVDTNFWLLFYEKAINIIDGIENLFDYKPFLILLPSPVLEELKNFTLKKNKRAIAAKSCLVLIEKLKEKKKLHFILTKERNADSSLINLARQKKALVATSDKALIKKLKKFNIRIITLKDKHLIQYL